MVLTRVAAWVWPSGSVTVRLPLPREPVSTLVVSATGSGSAVARLRRWHASGAPVSRAAAARGRVLFAGRACAVYLPLTGVAEC